MHHLLRFIPAVVTTALLGCAGPKPAPAEGPSQAPVAEATTPDAAVTTDRCSADYSVKASIVSGDPETLQEAIDGTVITDSAPFSCQLANKDASVDFSFDATVTGDNCPYALSYVNDTSGESFSGTQTLDCANVELDFTAKATPDTNDPNCRGKTTLVDDPKIILNTDNCGSGLE